MKNDPNTPKIVFDTMPIIKLFAKEDGWDSVQRILTLVEDQRIQAAISVITLTEIYYKYVRESRIDLAEIRTQQLRYSQAVKKLEVNQEIALKAGELKGKYNIPIADAFIAATAHKNKSIVLSDDEDFKKITEIKTLNETEFVSKYLNP